MIVRDAMTADVISVGPSHSLRDASRVMAERKIGSVVVHDPDSQGPGILTERDIVVAVASGIDVDSAPAGEHVTTDSAYGSPEWSLLEATEAMRRGGFRHLVIIDGGDVLGIISLRDVVRAWDQAG